MLFTLVKCGLQPRIASERFNSSELRFLKIKNLIESSLFSIHDLSRIKSKNLEEYFRLNMPFELGLDFGCKLFHRDLSLQQKQLLIFEPEKFSIQNALSDLSGVDVKCHFNSPEEISLGVRSWLSECGMKNLPGPNLIWEQFGPFEFDMNKEFARRGFKPAQVETLPVPEFLDFLTEWLAEKGHLPQA